MPTPYPIGAAVNVDEYSVGGAFLSFSTFQFFLGRSFFPDLLFCMLPSSFPMSCFFSSNIQGCARVVSKQRWLRYSRETNARFTTVDGQFRRERKTFRKKVGVDHKKISSYRFVMLATEQCAKQPNIYRWLVCRIRSNFNWRN